MPVTTRARNRAPQRKRPAAPGRRRRRGAATTKRTRRCPRCRASALQEIVVKHKLGVRASYGTAKCQQCGVTVDLKRGTVINTALVVGVTLGLVGLLFLVLMGIALALT